MFVKKLVLWLAAASLFLASCTAAPPVPTTAPTATPEPARPAPDRSPTPRETTPPATVEAVQQPTPDPPAPPVRTKVELHAALDYNRRFVTADQKIVFTNNSTDPLDELILAVEPNRYWGVFTLEEISIEGSSAPARYTLDKTVLSLSLDETLQPEQAATILVSFTLQVPEIPPPSDLEKPQPFGYTQRQLNLVDWYPYIPPYLPGQGWLVNKPWFFGEHQVYESADFQVEVVLVNPPGGLTLAASSTPEVEENIYRFRHEAARNFVFSASPMYTILEEKIGELDLRVYVFPFDVLAGEAVLRDTAAAMSLFREKFGPLPHHSLSVVEADFLDGMEYDGLFFLSRGFFNLYDGTPQGYLTAIAVHEAAHMWWYGLIGNDQAAEPWLDEALSTFSELLFYESVYPDALPWWWEVRIRLYQPEGDIGRSIYEYQGFRPYRDAVYLNGALFFYELRELMGEPAFFSFLQAYVRSKSFKISNSQSFFALLKEHTPEDVDLLVKKYFK